MNPLPTARHTLMTPRRRLFLIATPLTAVGLWLLPIALDSYLIAGLVGLGLGVSMFWGWWTKRWRPLILLATFAALIDLFGLAQLLPAAAGVVIAILWLAGLWLVGHIGSTPLEGAGEERGTGSLIFHQALASFLVLEVFFVLQLWPINVLSKAVIVVSFAFFLWFEFVRTVSPWQRLRDSVVPFLLIVALMTLTARWQTF